MDRTPTPANTKPLDDARMVNSYFNTEHYHNVRRAREAHGLWVWDGIDIPGHGLIGEQVVLGPDHAEPRTIVGIHLVWDQGSWLVVATLDPVMETIAGHTSDGLVIDRWSTPYLGDLEPMIRKARSIQTLPELAA